MLGERSRHPRRAGAQPSLRPDFGPHDLVQEQILKGPLGPRPCGAIESVPMAPGRQPPNQLRGRRVLLRPLVTADFGAWREVRQRNVEWLARWEPAIPPGQPDDTQSRQAFAARCGAREREWQMGVGYGFGLFVATSGGVAGRTARLAGEINLSGVQRGPFQNAYVGYWIDETDAGQGLMPESVVVLARFAFEDLGLHRLQVAIIPRNQASRRVVEKLELRQEGLAERYLAINGVWEDHLRYALTAEEWMRRGSDLVDCFARPNGDSSPAKPWAGIAPARTPASTRVFGPLRGTRSG
ncbi:MAG: GNAT family N-acetyltransferase [Pseudonocardiaceae bacterium]